MQITLTKASNPRTEGKWGKLDIEYVQNGKTYKRTLVAIGPTKEVMQVLRKEDAAGETFEIELETVDKDGQKFYNWVGAKKAEPSAAAEAKQTYVAKSNYETPEERAKKNVYICRQNALTNAVNYFVAKEGKASASEILNLANEFAHFSLNGLDGVEPEDSKSPKPAPSNKKAKKEVEEELEDDIPF
jgi:hypothetical protein